MKFLEKPLFTFEMANNHMGDVDHGLLIVNEFGKLIEDFPEFDFSMKLQYRDISFFHPKHVDRKDHRLIKRFTETRLSDEGFKKIVDEIHRVGFISMCTPWDEVAVDYQTEMGVQIIKIASCSFTDWRLLEKIAKIDLPVIASTAGATEQDILNVNEFFKNRSKTYALLHCVGEYPCEDSRLDLNQIDYLKQLVPAPVGYSTHEDPNNTDSIKIAIAKGSIIFEKHVGVANDRYALNAYSANPHQARMWLESARHAYTMCGGSSKARKSFSDKELADLQILFRGVYAKSQLEIGEKIADNVFLAMPNTEGQLVAKDLGKYKRYVLKKQKAPGDPVLKDDVDIYDSKEQVSKYRDQIKAIIEDSQILLPKSIYIELSHHYGIESFDRNGAALIHLLNRDYSKIVVVMLPGQSYPEHYHVSKDETYYIVKGTLDVKSNGEVATLVPGQMFSVPRGTRHSFRTSTGVVFEEIATRYIQGDSIYTDEIVNSTKVRKTIVLL